MVMSCPLKSRKQPPNLLCARASVIALAAARCSLCADVVIVVNAIVALNAAQRPGGSNGAPPTFDTSRPRLEGTVTSSVNAAIANGSVALA